MAKYRKKPIEIEAVQYVSENQYIDICVFVGQGVLATDSGKIIIPTLEGEMYASIGDYIIKGIKGEFYPCKPDIFKQSYDLVQE